MAASTVPTTLHAVSSSLTFLVPLFAFVLLVLTVSHPPTQASRDSQRRNGGRQTLNAYLAIWSLAILCTLSGAVGLKSTLGPSKDVMAMRGRGEVCVEALIFLELGMSILYLAHDHVIHRFKSQWIAVLVIELVVAVIMSFVYLPSSPGEIAPFLPPILSLLFLATLLPFLVFALRVHTPKQGQNNAQISPVPDIRTPSFAGTNASTASSSLPSTSAAHQLQDLKVSSPQSSISDLTAVNLYQLACISPRSPHVEANTLESGAASLGGGIDILDRRMTSSRSTSLLAILMACQASAFVAFAVEIAAVKVGLSASLNSAPSSVADASASTYAILEIVRVALMVLSITGIMSAFLVRAYNAYLCAAPTGPLRVADHPILPPSLNLSRMNAITVSISPTPAPLSATKMRTANNPMVFSAAVTSGTRVSKGTFGRKGAPKEALTLHSSSASYSSSFACPMAKSILAHSMLLSAETRVDKQAPRSSLRDSKLDDDEDGEPGYAYIYTDGQSSGDQQKTCSRTDPLNVGEPAPFRPRQHPSSHSRNPSSLAPRPSSKPVSIPHSLSDSIFTNHGIVNSFTPITPSSSLPSPPQEPIDIPTSKCTNPYPTPRSTPTATAFADRTSSSSDHPCPLPSDFMIRPPLSRASTSSSKIAKSVATYSSSDDHYPFPSEKPIRPASRTSYCSSSTTHIQARTSSSPTPTPTRAPTPGLMFTPFLGSYVRRRDSTTSPRVKSTPPTPPSPFLRLKEKAKKITSKHDSISESLAQSFEGIRNGLGGSNGKTKYPLRSSTSNSSLGLGLGMPGGFKFPSLTRRPSSLGKERRNVSSSTLAETSEGGKMMVHEPEPISPPPPLHEEPLEEERMQVEDEGDFMDLRDPFASPSALNGGSIRIMSSAELSIRTGRESRTGYREDDIFELEGAQTSRSASYGKAKGMRMNAWGRLPMSPPSASSSPSTSPHIPRYVQYHQHQTPTPSPSTRKKGRSRGSRSSKVRSGRSSGEGASTAGSCEGRVDEEEEFVCEEALIAQQLLRKLDEKLWSTGD